MILSRIAPPRGSAIVYQGRVGAPSLTHFRGVSRHCIQKKRCFAAEVWDAKGLAIPTLGYDFALPRGARKKGAQSSRL